jgi:hypothetical protein
MLRALLQSKNLSQQIVHELRDFLDQTSVADTFASYTGRSADWMKGKALEVEHVGFLGLPGMGKDRIAALLAEAGFPEQTIFPSRIVSRELTRLSSGVHVATTIVMAYRVTDTGRRVGIEVFLPEAEEHVVRDWIERGVASHLALSMDGRDAFVGTRSVLEADQFRIPAFKSDEPLTVLPWTDGAKFLSMYLDRHADEEKVSSRVELCCVVDRITPSLYPPKSE